MIEIQRVTDDLVETYSRILAAGTASWPAAPAELRHERAHWPGMTQLLARCAGEPAAAAWIAHDWTAGGSGADAEIAVPPRFALRGAGEALRRALREHALEHGLGPIDLGSLGDVSPADADGLSPLAIVVRARLELPAPAPAAVHAVVSLAGRPDLVPATATAIAAVEGGDPALHLRYALAHPAYPHRSLLVVEEDGRVLGYAALRVSALRQDEAIHELLGVLPDRRGEGIATSLKSELIRVAERAGLQRLWTENRAANVAARRLNERLGYQIVGEVTRWRQLP